MSGRIYNNISQQRYLISDRYRKKKITRHFLKNSIIAGAFTGAIWTFLNSYFHPLEELLNAYSRTDVFIIQTVIQGIIFIFLGVVVGIVYGMCLDLSYSKLGRVRNHHLKVLIITLLLWMVLFLVISVFFFTPENIFSLTVLVSFMFLFVTTKTRRE